ncbi:glycosyltransferase family 2 protein [Dankookia sp. GCM10030260]|uniref:glycosyltransferase family 2 protein n=1 Tax=Dankookia sp. GCM10030260 TaxID=3273390 RepID=UPI0036121DE3
MNAVAGTAAPPRPVAATGPATGAALTSVVIVSYQTGPALQRAVASALAQDRPVEVLLVDNGNPPETAAMLAAWAAREPRLRLLTGQGNIGFGAACNLGARAARGDALLLLNPDGELAPDALARLRRHAATLPSPWMIGPRILDGAGQDQAGSRRRLLTPVSALVEALRLHRLCPGLRLNLHRTPLPARITPVPAISGACMFLRREAYWRIGGFDEGYFLHVEDLDLCLRFRRGGGEILFAPDVVVRHLGGTSEAPKAVVERHKARSFRRYFRQNFPGMPKLVRLALDGAIAAQLGLRMLRGRLFS